MFGLRKGTGRRRPNLGTPGIDPDDPAIRPPVRLYICARKDLEEALCRRIIETVFEASGARIEDLSLPRDRTQPGAEGASADPGVLIREMSNRIRISDLVFVPDRTTDEPALRTEVETAMRLGRPVIFIVSRGKPHAWSDLLQQMEQRQTPARVCSPEANDLVWAARLMLPARGR